MAVQYPLTTVNKLAAETTVGVAGQKICYYGQMLSGTATSGNLYEITSFTKAVELFGVGSHLAGILAKVFDIATLAGFQVGKPFPTIYAIGIEDPTSGTKATSTITSSAEMTSSDTLVISIGDKVKNTYKVSFVREEEDITKEEQMAEIMAVLNADTSCPVVASITGSEGAEILTLTHKHKGKVGNNTYIEIAQPSVGGSTFTLTAFSGGAGEVVGSPTPLANIRMHNIVYPASWDRDLITAFAKASWNVDGKIKDTMLFFGTISAVSSITTAVADNHQTICPFYTKLIDNSNFKGSVHSTSVDAIPAIFATIFSLCVTSGSSLINFVPSGSTVGSPEYNAIPVHNTIIPNSILPAVSPLLDITDEEEALLRRYCYNTFRNNRADNTLLVRQVVTTYKTTALGYADLAFKYIENVKTTSVSAEYIFENMQKEFAKTTVTTGIPQLGSAQVTKDGISAALFGFVNDLVVKPYALIRQGALDDIFDSITASASLDIKNGAWSSSVIGAIVMQLREILVNFYTTIDYTENEI